MANNALSKFFRRWVSKANRPAAARKPRQTQLRVEAFEDRVVPAAVPTVSVDETRQFVAGAYNPASAIDPVNPLRMVVAYTNGTRLFAQQSLDGGLTWRTFLTTAVTATSPNDPHTGATPNPLDWPRVDPSIDPASGPRFSRLFTNTWAPSVVIGRDETVYVSALETNATKNSGAVVVRAFSFNTANQVWAINDLDTQTDGDSWADPFGAGPTGFPIYSNAVYSWSGSDPGLNPKLAIDNGAPSFTDPDTGNTQTDPMLTDANGNPIPASKGVYLVWNTNALTPTIGDLTPGGSFPYTSFSPEVFNPNAILLSASSDQGKTFSTPVLVNDTGYAVGPGFNPLPGTEPSIVFTRTQVTNGAVSPGTMSVLWNDVGTNPNGTSNLRIDTTVPTDSPAAPGVGNPANNAVDVVVANGAGGGITEPFPAMTGPDVPAQGAGINTYTTTVTVPANMSADLVTDLDVTLPIEAPHDNQLSITLTHNGTTVVLLVNRTLGDGTNRLPINGVDPGLPDQANIGVVEYGGTFTIGHREEFAGTVFDSEAPRYIIDPTNPAYYVAHYRPEGGSLAAFYNGTNTMAAMAGTWTVTVTDNRNDRPGAGTFVPAQLLGGWSLKFTGKLSNSLFNIGPGDPAGGPGDAIAVPAPPIPKPPEPPVIPDPVPGDWDNNNPLKPASGIAPTTGIGAGMSLAFDDSLGSTARFAGRMYVAYTQAVRSDGVNINDTNIGVMFSDDGGATWSGPVIVNGGDANPTSFFSTGRWDFMPEITVDPVTDQVVVMWYSAGNDASNARVASYMSVSNDGGATWSVPTYLDVPKTAVDAVTGQTINQEPIPSNLAAAGADGFGVKQALFAYDGKVTAFWTGNPNGTVPGGVTKRVYTTQVRTTSGPRVVQTDIGQITATATIPSVFGGPATFLDPADPSTPFDALGRGTTDAVYNNTFAADGTRQLDGFQVVFDRPVDLSTFGPDEIKVYYRSPTDTTAPGTPVAVSAIIPVLVDPLTPDPTEVSPANAINGQPAVWMGTTFFVKFATPQSAVGTYSYSIDPGIRDRIYTTESVAPIELPATDPNLAQFRSPFTNDTEQQGLPDFQPTATRVTTAPFTLGAIQLTFSDVPPDGISITNILSINGVSPVTTGANAMSVVPDAVNPTVFYITRPTGFAAGTYTVITGAASVNTVSATLPANVVVRDVQVEVNISGSTDVTQLALFLTGPNGAFIPLMNSIPLPANVDARNGAADGGLATQMVDTRFDDLALRSITTKGTDPTFTAATSTDDAPYTGSWRPRTSLRLTFAGTQLTGDWKLTVVDQSGVGGNIDSWSLIAEPGVEATQVTSVVREAAGTLLVTFQDKVPSTFTAADVTRVQRQLISATTGAQLSNTQQTGPFAVTLVGTNQIRISQPGGFPAQPAGDIQFYGVATTLSVAANYQDQNADARPQEYSTSFGKSNDTVAVPAPVNGQPFQLPFVTTSLPLSIPGPHVTHTFVPGQPVNLTAAAQSPAIQSITRQTAAGGSLVVQFATAPAAFTAADITSIVGPSGPVAGPFTVTPSGTTAGKFTITRTGGFPAGAYTLTTDATTLLVTFDRAVDPLSFDPTDIISIQYTSGTNSAPITLTGPFTVTPVTAMYPNEPSTQFVISRPGGFPGVAKFIVTVGNNIQAADELSLNKGSSAVVVEFDRDMRVSTFTPADVIKVTGPAGPVTGPFTISALYTAANAGATAGPLTITFQQPPASFTGANITSITGTGGTFTGPFTVTPVNATTFTIDRSGHFAPGVYQVTTPATWAAAPPTRRFEVDFPAQVAAGPYSMEVGSDIQSAREDAAVQSVAFQQATGNLLVTFATAPTTFRTQDIATITGPDGLPVSGPFTVAPVAGNAAQYTISRAGGFAAGTNWVYLNYAAGIAGDQVDTNLNAGLNVLRGGDPTAGQILRNSYTSTDGPIDLQADGTVSLPIDVADAFLITQAATANQLPAVQSVQWQANRSLLLTFQSAPASFTAADLVGVTQETNSPNAPFQVAGPFFVTATPVANQFIITRSPNLPSDGGFDNASYSVTVAGNPHIQVQLSVDMASGSNAIPDLIGELVAPDGTRITLFTNVGTQGNPPKDQFANTIFDDFGSTPIQLGSAPFSPIDPATPSNIQTYTPQLPLSQLVGHGSAGEWRLEITNTGSTPGTFNYWRILLPFTRTGTGLGEPIADRFQVGFRTFIQDPTNPVSKQQWTPIGPASINTQANAGRVTTVAVDPSDPSGNTVYAGGSSGGIWKTTNFLTQDPNGPTWVSLTDFGPTNGLNISSIAVVGVNSDPAKTMIFALTGDPNTQNIIGGRYGTPGVGVIRSLDAGQTWQVLDSTVNVSNPLDPQSPILPFLDPARDHVFYGATGYKIVADPTPTPLGEAILYMAVSLDGKTPTNPNQSPAGVWRSVDSGRTWTLVRAGEAMDVSLVAGHSVNGLKDRLYAAFRGQGVFFTSNATGATGMTAVNGGNTVNPLLRDVGPNLPPGTSTPGTALTILNSPLPATGTGRVVLATPAATGNRLLDDFYSSWVYCLTMNANGSMNGLYVSKDFGGTWTKVNLPGTGGAGTNDETQPNIDVGSPGGQPSRNPQGEEDISLTVDPLNPRIVYVGGVGATNGKPTAAGGMIRVDITNLKDAYAFDFWNNSDNVGGPQQEDASIGATTPKGDQAMDNNHPTHGGLYFFDPADPTFISNWYLKVAGAALPQDFLNLQRDPNNPFITPSTLQVNGATSLVNDGSDAYWSEFTDALYAVEGNTGTPGGNNDIQQVVPVVDPVTGTTRLIFATGQGVYTGVSAPDGQAGTKGLYPNADIGSAGDSPFGIGNLITGLGFTPFAFSTRNGNLQIAQLYSGTAQPSQLSADVAGAFYYGMSRDNGFPVSAANVLQSGNLNGKTLVADPNPLSPNFTFIKDPTGTGVVVDDTGVGSAFQFRFPNESGPGNQLPTDFVRAFLTGSDPSGVGVGRTGAPAGGVSSLVQPGDDPGNGVGQWPKEDTGTQTVGYLAINTYRSDTGDGLLISSQSGKVFKSFDSGATWFVTNSTLATPGGVSLDGTPARALAFGAPSSATTLPGQVNNFMYAGTVGQGTTGGHVFVSTDAGATWTDISAGLDGSSVMQIVTNPRQGSHDAYAVTLQGVYYIKDSTAAGATWINITGNLFNLQKPMFNGSSDQFFTLSFLDTIAADWRYAFPIDPNDPSAGTRPNLYVAGLGGVFKLRSLDAAFTADWSYYPDQTNEGAATDGGYMPNVQVTSLSLSLGNIDPTSGLPLKQGGQSAGLDTLVASTFGRGAFAIRLQDEPGNTVFVSGPKVVKLLNPNPLGGPSDRLDVQFDGPVDPATFDPSDIVFVKQLGGGNTQVIPINRVTLISTAAGNASNPRNLYEFTFASQVGPGTYSLTIGPNISDLAGNLMNQDGDQINGEPLEDQYRTAITLNGNTANLVVSAFPASVTAGTTQTFTVTATDANGATLTSFTGPVNISSSDPNAHINGGGNTLTGATLTAGTGTFTVVFTTAGTQSVTVTPTAPGINPGFAQTLVVAAGGARFNVTGSPPSITAGGTDTYTVTAVDQFGNPLTSGPNAYNGPVTFTDTDQFATFQNSPLPGTVNLTNGTGSFTLTLRTSGPQTVTVVNDPNNPTVTGSATTTVNAGPAVQFAVTGGTSTVAGQPMTVTVTAQDQFGNTATGYAGLVTFTSSDLQATLPPDSNLVNGTGTFTITLQTTGTQSVRASDVANPALTGVLSGIQVTNSPVPPPPPPVGGLSSVFAVGSGFGGQPQVNVYSNGGTPVTAFTPFPAGWAGQVDPTSAGFTGGNRVAVGDVTGDGVPDYIVGNGPTISSFVRVFDGKTGAEVLTFQPFEASFTGGIYVTVGDLTGDGVDDIIVTPDEGGGPRVEVFRGGDFALVANFFGIDDPAFRGGARAAVGDVSGDGRADLVIAAGFGGGPRVSVYDGTTITAGGVPTHLFNDFFIFDGPDAVTLRNGAFITVGDIDGDGFADIIGGGGPGGGPRIFGLSGQDLMRVAAPRARVVVNFFAGPDSSRGGIHLAAKNLDGDRFADLVVGSGAGDGSHVTLYKGSSLAAGGLGTINDFDAFPGDFSGVFVG
jgi:subtilisin-like proprotein convertase family protein